MKKIIGVILLTALLLCSCQKRDNIPQNSQGNVENSNSDISQQSVQNTNITPLPKHDEAWWWKNYIFPMDFILVKAYPVFSEGDNQQTELQTIILYAFREGKAENIKGSLYITEEDAKKYAPLAVGKDISEIYTEYCKNDEGKIGYYMNADTMKEYYDKISETDKGSNFNGKKYNEVVKVEYITPTKVKVYLEFAPNEYSGKIITEIYTFEQNEENGYRLLSRENKAEIIDGFEEKNLQIKAELPYKIYDETNMPYYKSFNYYNQIYGKDLYILYSTNIGINELFIYDTTDLEKKPEIITIKLHKDEYIGNDWYINDRGNIVIRTKKRAMEVSSKTGEILKEKTMPKQFEEIVKSLNEQELPNDIHYVVDDDMDYISFFCATGLYAGKFDGSNLVKICNSKLYKNFYSAYAIEIKDGILCYEAEEDGGTGYSLHTHRYYDIDKAEKIEPKIKIPAPQNEYIMYNKIIGDKVIGLDMNSNIEIRDLKTGKVITIPHKIDRDDLGASGWGTSAFTNGKDLYSFLAEEKTDDQYNPYIFRLRKVDLETGELSKPLFEMAGDPIFGSMTDDKILIYGNQLIVIDVK